MNNFFQNSPFPFRRWILLLVLVLIAGNLGAKLSESDKLPDLQEFALTGSIPEYEGKVVLLDFWASWCAPCKASFPEMENLYQEFKDQGFEIVAVGVDTTAKAFQGFAEKSKVSFPLVWDAEKKLVSMAQIETMPTSLLIGKDGTIRSVHEGFQGKKTVQTYREEISNLLKE